MLTKTLWVETFFDADRNDLPADLRRRWRVLVWPTMAGEDGELEIDPDGEYLDPAPGVLQSQREAQHLASQVSKDLKRKGYKVILERADAGLKYKIKSMEEELQLDRLPEPEVRCSHRVLGVPISQIHRDMRNGECDGVGSRSMGDAVLEGGV